MTMNVKRRLIERLLILLTFLTSLILIFSNNLHEIIAKGKPSIKLFCIILTHKEEFYEKAILINKTWASKCDKYFFVAKCDNSTQNSKELTRPVPILQPKGLTNDQYSNLTSKMYAALKEIYQRYNTFDWYLKADHDTYIFVDNLREFLMKQNKSAPITFGYNFKSIVLNGHHSGGAGYVLSREALMRLGEKLLKNYTSCYDTGIEDVDIASTLRDLNVMPGNSTDEYGRERFHLLDIESHLRGYYPPWMYTYAQNTPRYGSECCSASTISFHYMSNKRLLKTHVLWEEHEHAFKKNDHEKFIKFLHECISDD